MKRLNHFSGQDWIFPSYYHSTSAKLFPKTPEIHHFLHMLWPVAREYASPLGAFFIAECPSLSLLNKRPIWLIRDGLIALSWFFERNPKPPERFASRLLVAEELAVMVPTKWRRYFGTYRTVSMPLNSASNKRNKIVLTGLVNETYCSIAEMEKLSAKARHALKALRIESIDAYLPVQSDVESAFCGQFFIQLSQQFSQKINCLDWPRFNGMSSFDEYLLLDFNDSLICSDSYLVHSALSRGAKYLDEKKHLKSKKLLRSGESYVALSPYHGMIIRKRIAGAEQPKNNSNYRKELHSIVEQYQLAMKSKANLNYPWPQWLKEWSIEQNSLLKSKRG